MAITQALFLLQSYIPLFCGALALLYVLQAAYYITIHPFAKVPGPFLAKFSYLWKTARYARGRWHEDILKAHETYGPVVRTGPNEVDFVDGNALHTIYGLKSKALKSDWYQTWGPPKARPSLFTAQDAAVHRQVRARVSGAYSMTSVLALEPFIQEIADKTWIRFREFAATGTTIDLALWIEYFTFDVIDQLAFGGGLGFVERGEDVDDVIGAIHSGTWIMSSIGSIPWQMWWLNNSFTNFLLQTLGPPKANAWPNFLKWLELRVEKRISTGLGDRRKDMLQHFIEMKGFDGESTASKADVLTESVVALGAGADTTAYTIAVVLSDLIIHPEKLARVRAEVDKAYLGKTVDIPYTEAAALPYLSTVLKESLRVHPSVIGTLPRVAPRGGVQIGSYHIHAGIDVGVSPLTMNRCKEIFGQDAEEFRPERWIYTNAKEEDAVKEMSRMLMTFGMGSRVCIGQNIALVEAHKFVAQFIRNFDFKLADPNKLWRTRTAMFVYIEDFEVKLELRKHN